LFGRAEYIFLAEVCNIAATVILELLVGRFDSLHDILLLAHDFDVLLSDEFKEFAHLLDIWVVSFFIVPATRAVLVMLAIVSTQKLSDDGLKLRCQVALGTHEFERVFAFIVDHLLDTVSDTVLVLFRVSFLHLPFQVKSLLVLSCIILFDGEKLFLSESKLVF